MRCLRWGLSQLRASLEIYLFEVEGNYRGYFHHWWIFNIVDGEFWGFPKWVWMERDEWFDGVRSTGDTGIMPDFSFWWVGGLKLNECLLGASKTAGVGDYDREEEYMRRVRTAWKYNVFDPTTGFVRASPQCICETCGRVYIEHPVCAEIEGWQGPFLRQLCSGDLVKL